MIDVETVLELLTLKMHGLLAMPLLLKPSIPVFKSRKIILRYFSQYDHFGQELMQLPLEIVGVARCNDI